MKKASCSLDVSWWIESRQFALWSCLRNGGLFSVLASVGSVLWDSTWLMKDWSGVSAPGALISSPLVGLSWIPSFLSSLW